MAEPEPTPPVGAVTLTKLRAKTPDSIRVHPYNPKAHGASKYEMEPETRPPNYRPDKMTYFNMAKRKLHMLLLSLVVGAVILAVFLAIILLIHHKNQTAAAETTREALQQS
ncbi:uncharacterized protein LOC117291811 [Asterias rubens]|uniref:uncharacterized protein LOC117291811 n=1 Tax=Asterias rubens TaxID=7604 RepID=UPI00145500DC|nr:uncharacterized protein LOC117291811 [Asterias rubens]